MAYKYKGIPIDASFCTLGTLQVSNRLVNFPKASTTYLNSTADKINVNFGYKDASVDLSNKFNAYTVEFQAPLAVTAPNYSFTTSSNVTQSYCSPVLNQRYPNTGSIPSYFNNMKVLIYGDGGGGGGGNADNNTGSGGGAGATIIADISLNTNVSNKINYFNYSIGGGGAGGISSNNANGSIGAGTNITLTDGITNTILTAGGGGGGGLNSNVNEYGGIASITISPTMKVVTSSVTGGAGAPNAANNQWGGPGGSGSNVVTGGTSFTYTLSANRQQIDGGSTVSNFYCGYPGTDNTGLFHNTLGSPNAAATYYFYDKNVVIGANTINNTTRIGYCGGGGGGGSNNPKTLAFEQYNTVGGPGAPGFIKIWLYA